MSETMAKEDTDINIFAVRGCESIGITRQIFVHWYLQLVNTKWALAFLHPQQSVFTVTSSLVQDVITHCYPARVFLGNTILFWQEKSNRFGVNNSESVYTKMI